MSDQWIAILVIILFCTYLFIAALLAAPLSAWLIQERGRPEWAAVIVGYTVALTWPAWPVLLPIIAVIAIKRKELRRDPPA